MGNHRASSTLPPPPAPEVCGWPKTRHLLAWDGYVAVAPDGQLVGRWSCKGANCDHAEPRIIPEHARQP